MSQPSLAISYAVAKRNKKAKGGACYSKGGEVDMVPAPELDDDLDEVSGDMDEPMEDIADEEALSEDNEMGDLDPAQQAEENKNKVLSRIFKSVSKMRNRN